MSQVHPLKGQQRDAVDPGETVWLSASAGTGKTQVLSARVLRLLLTEGTSPSQVLCLTFTKAGAAEMAVRVNEVLANWVRMPDTALFEELAHIGAPNDPETRDRARTLFASVLDCPGGGLRIDTIHAFAQWLLAAFPEEAGLSPGTRAMEDRDRALLSRDVLSRLLLDAEEQGDEELLSALEMLTLRMKSEDVEPYLQRCASAREAWFGPGSWTQGDLRPQVNRLLGLAEDASEIDLLGLCDAPAFDLQSLRDCAAILGRWGKPTGLTMAGEIAVWLTGDEQSRYAGIDHLYLALFNKGNGAPSQFGYVCKFDPNYADAIARVGDCITAIRDQRTLLQHADYITPALTLGRAFAKAWDEAKAREGLIDFDDQIRQAADLLSRDGLSNWIRYKLDRRFDHVLVDEAQDTNAAQWQIINALTDDFYSGEGQHGDAMRTLFVVGDYKQAIFRFQGTSPENFELARERVRAAMSGLAENRDSLRDGRNARTLQEPYLNQSFRTANDILRFVDRATDHIGFERLGLKQKPELHKGQDRPGMVTFWQPVSVEKDADGSESESGDEGEEGWLSRPDRQLANRIARQVKAWMQDGFPLIKGSHRRAGPGDVMVLVRRRKELAGLIVARLHAAGVPVAGVDRLRLGAPLAVKDLVAAMRFAVQPFDDLNLAALLVSPLIGWSQEQLLEHGYALKRNSLWAHLRNSREDDVQVAVAQLLELLGKADYEPPQALLHWLLVGPWQGRKRLVARLGLEANDPIDELLNAAHAFAMSDTPSIIAFLHWFDAGDGELKREAEGAGGLVRVMTVHGSKGLQAPIVILADAASNPKGKSPAIDLVDPRGAANGPGGPVFHSPKIPLPPLPKEEMVGRLLEEQTKMLAEEMEEHWRLLYVAMTRAEEALFITGSLGATEKEPAADSWYARLAETAEGEWAEDLIWGKKLEIGSQPALPPLHAEVQDRDQPMPEPRWLRETLVAEPRPPRPLAPSSLGEDHAPDPPHAPGAMPEAARRGVLVHKLLERLPELAVAEREAAALRWLTRAAPDMGEAAHREMTAAALGVLAQTDWAELFSPAALAEVPITALVGDRVVAGTIDRLLIKSDAIRLVDFKTGRRPPQSLAEVPVAYLRQMAAYAAALEVTYPGRRIETALLYTQTPLLLEIPAQVIAVHKMQLSTGE